MKIFEKIKLTYVCIGASAFFGAVMLLIMFPHNVAAAPLTATDIPNQPTTAVNWDSSCRKAVPGFPNVTRAQVDDGGAYQAYQWISSGIPSKTVVTVPYDTQSQAVPMQFNTALFMCFPVIESWQQVTPGNFPADSDPRPETQAIYGASLDANPIYTPKNSVDVDGGANITGQIESGALNIVKRDDNSRYWFSTPTPFTLNLPAGLSPGDHVYTVHLKSAVAWGYYAPDGEVECADRMYLGTYNNIDTLPYAECGTQNLYYSITIHVVAPSITITGKVFNWKTGVVLPNAGIATCGYGNVLTDAQGQFSFAVPLGNTFCVQAVNGVVAGGHPVYVRPFAFAPSGDGYAPDCAAFSYGERNPDYCPEHAYQCQIAGEGYRKTNCPPLTNRASSNGYDLVYDDPEITGHINPTTSSCTTINGDATDPDHPGDKVSIDTYVDGQDGEGGTFVGRTTTDAKSTEFSVDIAAYRGYDARNFYVYVVDPDGGPNILLPTYSPGQCAQPSCNPPDTVAVDEQDNNPEPNQPFTVNASGSWQPYDHDGTGTPPAFTLQLGPGLTEEQPPGPALYPTTGTPVQGGGALDENQAFTVEASAPGNYSFIEHLDGTSCRNTVQVDNKPYLKVFGGNTVSGSRFETDSTAGCTNPNAGAYAWMTQDSSTTNYHGSSTGDGAFVASLVKGFASASGRSAGQNGPLAVGNFNTYGNSLRSPPQSLTYANTDSGGSTQGGNFDSGINCAEPNTTQSYYTALLPSPDLASKTKSTFNSFIYSGQKNVYLTTNDVQITGTGIMASSTSGWTTPSSMPLFYVVAEGANIYISNTVSTLDGVYIAEPVVRKVDGVDVTYGGNIYTCSNFKNTDMFESPAQGGCDNKLTVNGAFIARDVHLQRTLGTVDATYEPMTAGESAACNMSGTSVGPGNNTDSYETGIEPICSNAAEVFNYTPMDWLTSPFIQAQGFDALSEKSPIF